MVLKLTGNHLGVKYSIKQLRWKSFKPAGYNVYIEDRVASRLLPVLFFPPLYSLRQVRSLVRAEIVKHIISKNKGSA